MSDFEDLQAPAQAYEGTGFHPGMPKGRASGKLSISADSVHFEADSAQARLPLSGLQVKLGGASNRLIFFSHPTQPQWSIYTSDDSILRNPSLQSHDAVTEQIRKLRGEKRSARFLTAAVVLVIVSVLFGFYLLRDPLFEAVAQQVPASVEVALGELTFSQLKAGYSFVEAPELVNTLQALADPLLASVSEDRYTFQIHIVEDPTVNAFALPGGHVAVHTGLLLRADSPEEVAGVLAHEIAHVSRRHSLRQIISAVGLFTVVQAFFGDMTGIGAILADSGAHLLTLQFSRDFEREADDTGWGYLLETDINPRGMLSFFEKLHAEEKDLGAPASAQGYLSFLSTHPTTNERIERLQQKLRDLEEGSRSDPFGVDFRAFQEALRRHESSSGEEGEEHNGSED